MIGLLFFSLSTTVIAADISCRKFVTLSEDEAQSIINTEAKGIVIPKLGDKTKKDLEKVKQQLKVSNLPKCIFLRSAHLLDVDDLQRIEALKKLANMQSQLTPKEKTIYQKSLAENKAFFSIYSDASLVDAGVCQYPLLYLELQKNTEKGKPLIFEQRLVSGKVKTFSLYQRRNESFKCGKYTIQKNYAELLNVPKPTSTSSEPNCKFLTCPPPKASASSPSINTFFKAKNYHTGVLEEIPLNSKLFNIENNWEKHKNEVFFKYNDQQYHLSEIDWKKSRKK